VFYRGGDWGVRFEVATGLDFAVGGDEAANWSALDCGGANPQWGSPRENWD
jgi:hypothetical protein